MKKLVVIIKECHACPYYDNSYCKYADIDMDPLDPPTYSSGRCPLNDFIDPEQNQKTNEI